MSIPFPSQEWTIALCNALNESSAYAKAAQKWEGDLLLLIDGVGGVYLDLWHGACRKAGYTEDPDSTSAEFTISGSMQQWESVLRGELDPIQGLVKRQLKLKGNLVKIMKNVQAAQELVACAVGIDTLLD